MDQIKIGKYIQKLRKEKGLTQKELADHFNISFQAVSKWENGETLPDSSLLLELSSILGTSVDSLLTGGIYLFGERKLMSIKDIEKGFQAIKDVGKYFGKESYFYKGMIEGINNKMNLDLEELLSKNEYREALVTEVLLQGIMLGNYYVDINEVKSYFIKTKYVEYIENAMSKI